MNQSKSGEKNLNKDIKPQAKAVAFLQKIDDWIEDSLTLKILNNLGKQ